MHFSALVQFRRCEVQCTDAGGDSMGVEIGQRGKKIELLSSFVCTPLEKAVHKAQTGPCVHVHSQHDRDQLGAEKLHPVEGVPE
jgi:hypothetical protein